MTPQLSPYLLFNGIALSVCLLVFDQSLASHQPIRRDAAYVVFVAGIVVAWFGAHVFDWLVGAQSFGKAGFIFYGGLFSGCLFVTTVGRCCLSSDELWRSLNAAVIPLLMSQGIGRIGCFFAGCCYGVPIAGSGVRHPTQLYESAYVLLLALWLSRRAKSWFGWRVCVYTAAYPVFRFMVEMLRGDERGQAFGLSTSQCMSLMLLGASGICAIRAMRASVGAGVVTISQEGIAGSQARVEAPA